MVLISSYRVRSSEACDPRRAAAVAKVLGEMKKIANSSVLLEEWADFVSLNKYELTAAFKKFTGMPPMAFHNAEKLEIAKRLLVFEQMPVTEVCFEIGFESVGSFISKFTNSVGVSPGSYARVMRDTGFTAIFTAIISQASSAPSGPGLRVWLKSPARLSAFSLVAAVFPRPYPSGYPVGWRFIPPFCRVMTIDAGLTGYCLAASFPIWPRLTDLVNFYPALIGRQALDKAGEDLSVELRAPTIFDPPITLAVPALLCREVTRL